MQRNHTSTSTFHVSQRLHGPSKVLNARAWGTVRLFGLEWRQVLIVYDFLVAMQSRRKVCRQCSRLAVVSCAGRHQQNGIRAPMSVRHVRALQSRQSVWSVAVCKRALQRELVPQNNNAAQQCSTTMHNSNAAA